MREDIAVLLSVETGIKVTSSRTMILAFISEVYDWLFASPGHLPNLIYLCVVCVLLAVCVGFLLKLCGREGDKK